MDTPVIRTTRGAYQFVGNEALSAGDHGADVVFKESMDGIPMRNPGHVRSKLLFLAAVLAFGMHCMLPGLSAAVDDEPYAKPREALIKEIEATALNLASLVGRDTVNPRVLNAIRKVPRHEFVSEYLRAFAYDNRPLPIGHGQTVSQPYLVAVMTDLLDLEKGHTVLEIGTGSGYQAAVLAECVKEVYTIEILEELGKEAQARLKRLGYMNVEVRIGDGYGGWKEKAPFDRIIVTAAGNNIPPLLIEQLKPGGRMVIPVGEPHAAQQLMLIEKKEDGKIKTRLALPVAFVPLTGGH
ncbi:MAG: protein-L-isoaspartate(D-aspartate) O-methyltransferase [Syntrophobacteraceae bacterium]